MNTSVPITSVAVPIISRCRFSRCASVRKSILTAVCWLEICNYHHSSVTQRAQGVCAPFCLWANTKRNRKFPQAFEHTSNIQVSCSFPLKTKILAFIVRQDHTSSILPGATLILTLIQQQKENSDRLWLWLHPNLLLTLGKVSLCTNFSWCGPDCLLFVCRGVVYFFQDPFYLVVKGKLYSNRPVNLAPGWAEPDTQDDIFT